MGVAFYDKDGDGYVQMKLYKITRGQLNDIRMQEGAGDSWYGRRVFLGFDNDGVEIYTLTSKDIRPQNEPSAEYLELIKKALTKECGYTKNNALSYIKDCKKSI